MFILASLLVPSASATTVNLGVDAADWAKLFAYYNSAANNDYGSPASVTWSYDPDNTAATVAINYTKCGAFLGQAFQIGAGLTASEIDSLTTMESPEAAKWYDAIDTGASVGTVNIDAVTMSDLEKGDLLVSKYPSATDTGHAMLVWSVQRIAADGNGFTSVVPASPANASDTKWMVVIYDSTKTPHGANPSNTAKNQGVQRDSRNEFQDATAEDQGMGVGTIVVYTDSTNGNITGWRWSYNGSYYSQVPTTGTTTRPLIAGRITDEI